MYWGLPYKVYEQAWCNTYLEGSLTEVQFYSIRTVLMNGDENSAIRKLLDWGKLRVEKPEAKEEKAEKTCEIAKFVPGEHYYCLGEKFSSLEEAKLHATKKNYKVTRVFDVTGDGLNKIALKEVLRKRDE